MGTSMSVAPILAADRPGGPRPAGWRRSDLWWERVQVRAKTFQLEGNVRAAARYWTFGHLLGVLFFPASDPRSACGIANAAAAARLHGRVRAAELRLRRARVLWSGVPDWLETMRLAPRARSSLHHLRMTVRHGDAFDRALKARLMEQVREAEERLIEGRLEPPGDTSRWVVERPPVYDDTRRLAAACFLLAFAGPRRERDDR